MYLISTNNKIVPYLRSIAQEPGVEEGVGHAKLEEDDKEVHNLTTNETKEIHIIPK